MKEGVQKYLSFNVFFRQTQNPPYKLTDKKLSNEFYKIIDSFEELASAAQKKHDELQVKYNTEAHSSAAGYSGVTQVQEI